MRDLRQQREEQDAQLRTRLQLKRMNQGRLQSAMRRYRREVRASTLGEGFAVGKVEDGSENVSGYLEQLHRGASCHRLGASPFIRSSIEGCSITTRDMQWPPCCKMAIIGVRDGRALKFWSVGCR